MKSGILDKLNPDDSVMADKGFLIKKELAEKNCVQLIFMNDKIRFILEKKNISNKISRLRVYIDKTIGRIKQFTVHGVIQEKTFGIIHRMEEKLQTIICQLYSNELSLKHLLNKIDGKTSDPHGSLKQKILPTYHSLPIPVFEPIENNLDRLFPEIKKRHSAQVRNTAGHLQSYFIRILYRRIRK